MQLVAITRTEKNAISFKWFSQSEKMQLVAMPGRVPHWKKIAISVKWFSQSEKM